MLLFCTKGQAWKQICQLQVGTPLLLCCTLPTLTSLTIIIMADLIRSAKTGGQWTLKDLDSYHISLNRVDPLPFFGLQVSGNLISL